MESTGVMQEIRELLLAGHTSREVMEMGYAPGSVYKVQWQLRKQGKLNGKATFQGKAVTIPLSNQPIQVQLSQLQTEKAELQNEVTRLREEVEEAASLRAELEEAVGQIGELEAEVSEAEALRDQIKSLAAEAKDARDLRQQVRQLEGRNKEYVSTLIDHCLKAQEREARVKMEREARQKAEQEAEEYRQKSEESRQEAESLRAELSRFDQLGRAMLAELRKLIPLKVWQGHPCAVCKKPMLGLVSREAASKLMKDIGHSDCLDKQGSNLGKLLLAGAGLYGLSKLR